MEAARLADYCDNVLDLSSAKLGSEYYYQSLPLCILDAVFSIGVRYASTQNVVSRYSSYCSIPKYRGQNEALPQTSNQQSVEEFIRIVDQTGAAKFADQVLQNHQRTSSRNGILKADAAYEFAKILVKYGVNYFQDIHKIQDSEQFEADIKRIPGQSSGICLKYFFMLAGDEKLIKPDRMIQRFLQAALSKEVSAVEAQRVLMESSELLRRKHSNMTPRLLDYQIWNHQRAKGV